MKLLNLTKEAIGKKRSVNYVIDIPNCTLRGPKNCNFFATILINHELSTEQFLTSIFLKQPPVYPYNGFCSWKLFFNFSNFDVSIQRSRSICFSISQTCSLPCGLTVSNFFVAEIEQAFNLNEFIGDCLLKKLFFEQLLRTFIITYKFSDFFPAFIQFFAAMCLFRKRSSQLKALMFNTEYRKHGALQYENFAVFVGISEVTVTLMAQSGLRALFFLTLFFQNYVQF